jgi:UDPglucose--hexose-1-phosphate uridylyltransferase
MPVLRQDVSTKEWVIMATERAKRPHEFVRPDSPKDDRPGASVCPFCPGNEAMTPPEVLAFRMPGGTKDGPGWWVRVTPNKFAALNPNRNCSHMLQNEFFPYMEGAGVHEVIIESPMHTGGLTGRDCHHVAEVLYAFRLRFRELRQNKNWKAIIIFKNHGEKAGTSLSHSHSQLVATPVVPRDIRLRHAVAEEHYDSTGQCIYCEMLHHELLARDRIVDESPRFVAFHPYASRVPFETWILPRTHSASFGNVGDDEIRDLADVLFRQLRKLKFALNDPDYNFIIHTAPLEDESKDYYLWHLQIYPRLTTIAGFELGSGISINTALPEETAAFIRDARTL